MWGKSTGTSEPSIARLDTAIHSPVLVLSFFKEPPNYVPWVRIHSSLAGFVLPANAFHLSFIA